MRKLLIYLKDYKKESILGPLFKLLEASFELFVPLVMAAIIDVGIADRDKTYILKMCGVLILLAVIGLVCSITAQFFAAKAAVGFAAKLRRALFAHIQSLSYTEMDAIGTSTMITRMTSDINQVQSGVNMVLRLFLRSPFIVFGAMVMAFTIDVKAALIFVVIIPLLAIVVFGIMLITIPLFKKVQSGLDGVLGITRENLTGSRVIRAFHKEKEEIETFQEKNRLLTNLQLYVGKISALMNPLTYIMINAALLALIWVGAVRVDNGAILQGEVVALVNYMSQILIELVKLANLIITVTKAVACGNRIQGVFEIQSSMSDGHRTKSDAHTGGHPARKQDLVSDGHRTKSDAHTGGNPAIKQDLASDGHRTKSDAHTGGDHCIGQDYAVCFDNVSMGYQGGGEYAVSNINLKVKRGETIGVIGGTGSGKSTVVNLIPRFYDVSEGTVYVSGEDVRDYKLSELRDKIGIVPQKAVLFAGTIRENMKWGKADATDEEINEALDIAQAREFVEQKQGKLDEEIEQGGRNLSGGQKQRLTIARALVKKPEILILDDSASALDYATDAALRRSIREMKNAPTVFIVSQRAASILHADQILVLDDGEVAGLGTHAELLENCEVYQEIYYSQFSKEEGEEVHA